MFDITTCYPLSPAPIWDGLENPLNLLKIPEEFMGRKDKNIPKSPSRLCHSCEAVFDANFYPRRLTS